MAFKKRIFFLHGFLGRPVDWNPVLELLQIRDPNVELICCDLFNDPDLQPTNPLSEFGSKFVKHFQITKATQNYLVGYSMGGRLGLHVLDFNSKLWSGAVFVSTGTGLKTEAERKLRIPDDQKWAERFLTEDFTKVMIDWNAQPIFQKGVEPRRHEKDYDPRMLAGALTNWSLAYQKDFSQVVSSWDLPQAWLCGEGDPKYQGIYQGILKSPYIHIQVVERASHRIMFDRPDMIAQVVRERLLGKNKKRGSS